MTRPTIKEIVEARKWFAGDGRQTLAHLAANYPKSCGAIVTLLAATEPPTDDEIASLSARMVNSNPWTYATYEENELAHLRNTRATREIRSGSPVLTIEQTIRHFLGPVKP